MWKTPFRKSGLIENQQLDECLVDGLEGHELVHNVCKLYTCSSVQALMGYNSANKINHDISIQINPFFINPATNIIAD